MTTERRFATRSASGLPTTHDEEYHRAAAIIKRSRDMTQTMMRDGFIEAEES